MRVDVDSQHFPGDQIKEVRLVGSKYNKDQAFLWFMGTALPKFKENYGVKRDITTFKSFLERSGGGFRQVRFIPSGPTNRGYCISVDKLPPSLIKDFFQLLAREEVEALMDNVWKRLDPEGDIHPMEKVAEDAANTDPGGPFSLEEETLVNHPANTNTLQANRTQSIAHSTMQDLQDLQLDEEENDDGTEETVVTEESDPLNNRAKRPRLQRNAAPEFSKKKAFYKK